MDPFAAAAALPHRSNAREALHLAGVRESFPLGPEGGDQTGHHHLPSARQGVEHSKVGVSLLVLST
jgi:hypothetical protein